MTDRKLGADEVAVISGIRAHAPLFGDLCEAIIRKRGLISIEADIEEMLMVIRSVREGKKVVGR